MKKNDTLDITKPGKPTGTVRIQCIGDDFTVNPDYPDPTIQTNLEWLANFRIEAPAGDVRYKLLVAPRGDQKQYYILKEGSSTPTPLDTNHIFTDSDPSVGMG